MDESAVTPGHVHPPKVEYFDVPGLTNTDPKNYYLDVGEFRAGPAVWTSVDHYLDIVVRTGRGYDFLDADELVEARVENHLDTETATTAMNRSVYTVAGLAAHDYDLDAWLASLGMTTTWRPQTVR